MPWPDTVAAKIVSRYIAVRYDLDAITLRRFDPPMGSMPFFNNSATGEIRRGELILVAGSMLKSLEEMGIPLEGKKLEGGKGADDVKAGALEELADAMNVENANSSKMVAVIDDYYKFRDEV